MASSDLAINLFFGLGSFGCLGCLLALALVVGMTVFSSSGVSCSVSFFVVYQLVGAH